MERKNAFICPKFQLLSLFIALGLIGYVSIAESIGGGRCTGNVYGVSQSGPLELQVEFLAQNSGL